MKGFSRSIRYFSIMAAQYIGLCFLAAVICFLIRYVRRPENLGEESFFIMILLILCIFIATLSMGHYLVIPPIVLSCSGTRRQIFWGTQWMMLLIVSAILALSGIYCMLFTDLSGLGFLKLLPSFIGLFSIAVGLGALLGGLVLCFGRAAAIVMSICSGLFGGVVGFCSVALFSESSFLFSIIKPIGDGIPYLLLWGLLILLAGSVVIHYVILHKAAVNR